MTQLSLRQAAERLLRYAALLDPPWLIHDYRALEVMADGMRDRKLEPREQRTPKRIRQAAVRYYGAARKHQWLAYAQARKRIPDDGWRPRENPRNGA